MIACQFPISDMYIILYINVNLILGKKYKVYGIGIIVLWLYRTQDYIIILLHKFNVIGGAEL